MLRENLYVTFSWSIWHTTRRHGTHAEGGGKISLFFLTKFHFPDTHENFCRFSAVLLIFKTRKKCGKKLINGEKKAKIFWSRTAFFIWPFFGAYIWAEKKEGVKATKHETHTKKSYSIQEFFLMVSTKVTWSKWGENQKQGREQNYILKKETFRFDIFFSMLIVVVVCCVYSHTPLITAQRWDSEKKRARSFIVLICSHSHHPYDIQVESDWGVVKLENMSKQEKSKNPAYWSAWIRCTMVILQRGGKAKE